MFACGRTTCLCLDADGKCWSLATSNDLLKNENFPLISTIEKIKEPIQSVACGHGHTLCLDYNGNVWSFGGNFYGQLGSTKEYSQIPLLEDIISISCGINSSACIDKDHNAWAFGLYISRKLLKDDQLELSKPVKIELQSIKQVACGDKFLILLTTDGKIYSMGEDNHLGQLGRNTSWIFNNIPKRIKKLPIINSIACGMNHSILLADNHKVYVFGSNCFGQLGFKNIEIIIFPALKTDLPNISSIYAAGNNSMVVDCERNLWVAGTNKRYSSRKKFVKIDEISNVFEVACGYTFSIVKEYSGDIWACGTDVIMHAEEKIDTSVSLNPDKFYKLNSEISDLFNDVKPLASSNKKSARK